MPPADPGRRNGREGKAGEEPGVLKLADRQSEEGSNEDDAGQGVLGGCRPPWEDRTGAVRHEEVVAGMPHPLEPNPRLREAAL